MMPSCSTTTCTRMFRKYGTTSLFWSTHVCAMQCLWPTTHCFSQTVYQLKRVRGYDRTSTCINSGRDISLSESSSVGVLSSVKRMHRIGRVCTFSPIINTYRYLSFNRNMMEMGTSTTRPFTVVVSTGNPFPGFVQFNRCSPKATFVRCNRKLIRAYSSQSSIDVSSLLERLQGLEDSLRYKGYSTIRIAMVFAVTIGLAVYLFRESLRDNVAGEVSHVASRSLEDEMVIGKVEEFAKSLLKTIGHDDNMQRMAADFVRQVIQREESREAVKQLLLSVLNDPDTRRKLGQTFQEVITEAVADQSTLTALKSALHDIVQDDGTKEAVKELVRSVFAQDEVVAFTSGFFKEVINSEPVVHQATTLGKQVTQNVIADPTIQVATGNTIWKAVKWSLTPTWFNRQDKIETETTEEKPRKLKGQVA